MSKEVMQAILNKIKDYDHIVLFRHIRIDGDCVGSTKGLKAIIQATWPKKTVIINDGENSDFLSFLGPDDKAIPDSVYKKSLGIVLDTASTNRISNQKFALCKELVKIDHHIPVDNYGNLAWVEEHASSTCELIVKFYDTFKEELVLTREAATYLYTGMVTDSGRFRFREVSGDTMRYAAILLDQNIDTDVIYANLYMESLDTLKFKAYVYEHIQLTENGVAYIFVDKEMQEKFHLSREAASASVSYLEKIRGSLCWLAFIDSGDNDGAIRVRLRSRFMTINQLAEQYNGGGHACASGATVYSVKEMQELIAKADAMLKEYKENHDGWL